MTSEGCDVHVQRRLRLIRTYVPTHFSRFLSVFHWISRSHFVALIVTLQSRRFRRTLMVNTALHCSAPSCVRVRYRELHVSGQLRGSTRGVHENLSYTTSSLCALDCNLRHLTSDCMPTSASVFLPRTVTLFCSLPACNVLYINSVDMESLTGPQAIAKAITQTLATNPLPAATTVHFKVSTQGITLTDSQRK